MKTLRSVLMLLSMLPCWIMAQNVYNVNYQTLDFSDNPTTVLSGTAKNTNARYYYSNVITIDGQVIDAIVTISGIDAGVTISDVDKTLNVARNFESNINVGSTSLPDGGVTFKFDFIKGGTQANPVPVILQNVLVNSYDIDGLNGKYQFQEFNGFNSFTLSNQTTLTVSQETNGFTRFKGNGTNATSGGNNITLEDNWRVKVLYDYMTTFSIKVGAQKDGGTAYFSLEFGAGALYSAPLTIANPTVNPKTSSVNTVTLTGTYGKPENVGTGVTITAFTVKVNGVTYTTSNGLTYSNGTWSVNTQSIPNGTYDVSVGVTYKTSATVSTLVNDETTNELIINNTTPPDNTAPYITEILRNEPTGQDIQSTTLQTTDYVFFRVNFSEPVQQVSTDDFILSGTGSQNSVISSITPISSSSYLVRVSAIPTSNTGDLKLVPGTNNISDLVGNGLLNISPSVLQFYTILSSLPLHWISFTGIQHESGIELQWETELESGTKDFIIQHSINGIDWKYVGIIPSLNSSGTHTYKFNHNNIEATNYYRIMQRDIDGSSSYSKVIFLRSITKKDFNIINTTVQQGQLQLSVHRNCSISVYDQAGHLIAKRKVQTGILIMPIKVRGWIIVRSNETTERIFMR